MIITRMMLHSAITGGITELVKIKISNDGTGTQKRGNYRWTITGKRGRKMKEGRLVNWPRLSKTPLELLQRIINTAYPNAVGKGTQ